MSPSAELLLNYVRRFIPLTEAEEAIFRSMMHFKTLRRKQLLLEPGEVARYDYFVVKGCLKCYTLDEKGNEHILMFAPEEWWTSDMYSFITQTPASIFVEAIEPTEIIMISHSDFERLYEEVPGFNKMFRILLQNAYVAQQKRINQKMSLSAEERYKEFLLKYPQLENRVPLKQIAAYLGITPEFLSMIRRKQAGR